MRTEQACAEPRTLASRPCARGNKETNELSNFEAVLAPVRAGEQEALRGSARSYLSRVHDGNPHRPRDTHQLSSLLAGFAV